MNNEFLNFSLSLDVYSHCQKSNTQTSWSLQHPWPLIHPLCPVVLENVNKTVTDVIQKHTEINTNIKLAMNPNYCTNAAYITNTFIFKELLSRPQRPGSNSTVDRHLVTSRLYRSLKYLMTYSNQRRIMETQICASICYLNKPKIETFKRSIFFIFNQLNLSQD